MSLLGLPFSVKRRNVSGFSQTRANKRRIQERNMLNRSMIGNNQTIAVNATVNLSNVSQKKESKYEVLITKEIQKMHMGKVRNKL